MSTKTQPEQKQSQSFKAKDVRWDIFIPAFIVFAVVAVVALINGEALGQAANQFFFWSLDNFGWLYQYVVLACTVLCAILAFSKIGNIKIGGKDAKPKYSFWTWFAMTLTGGVATGIVTWGVNEPIIYYGNIWGELDGLGIAPFTDEAARFAIGRSYMNWSFLPYGIYALVGALVAYLYFNKKQKLNVTSTLKPLFGEKVTRGPVAAVIDCLSTLALGVGICGGLAMCITLVETGLRGYGTPKGSMGIMIIIGVVLIAMFSFSSYIGMDKGLKVVGSMNAWFYYALLAILLIGGPTLFILRNGTAGLAEWADNFFLWGLDPIDIGGAPLTRSWTLFDWACWIAYAPVTGIFLAMMSRGRTIREFMMVNWILPSVFGLIWFGVWGNNALHMQMSGKVDLVAAINEGGSVMALWTFLQNLSIDIGSLHIPIGVVIVPINILIIIASFVTAADATMTNIGSMCMKDVPIGTEPPGMMKVIWGAVIGVVAIVMAAFGGDQGVDGVKALAAAGGFLVLFIFLLQIVSSIKVFFTGKASSEVMGEE